MKTTLSSLIAAAGILFSSNALLASGGSGKQELGFYPGIYSLESNNVVNTSGEKVNATFAFNKDNKTLKTVFLSRFLIDGKAQRGEVSSTKAFKVQQDTNKLYTSRNEPIVVGIYGGEYEIYLYALQGANSQALVFTPKGSGGPDSFANQYCVTSQAIDYEVGPDYIYPMFVEAESAEFLNCTSFKPVRIDTVPAKPTIAE